MKKKLKLKKEVKYVILLLVIVLTIIIIFNLFKSKSYSVEYSKSGIDISENYLKEEKSYYFELIHNKIKYTFISKQEYINDSKLIKDINIVEDDDEVCLIIESEYITSYPLCSKNKELIDYHLVSEKLKEEINDFIKPISYSEKKLNNYTIYYENENLLLWNYKGFYKLEENDMEYIKIFTKDIYNISLATKINNYILIPNYEQKYNFNEMYLLNLEDNSVEKWKLEYEISFDSIVLGINDKSVYILDEKDKIEYELVPHKQKMRIVGTENKKGTLYEYGEEIKESITTIISENKRFKYQKDYIYSINSNNLYLTYFDSKEKIKISNESIQRIVNIDGSTIYYLTNNTLYKYNPEYGEIKLIEYSEWEFNNNNMVFIN